MYEVIYPFIDGEDGLHQYKVGDEYPYDGKKVGKERLEQLLGTDNLVKAPLIKEKAQSMWQEEKPKKK